MKSFKQILFENTFKSVEDRHKDAIDLGYHMNQTVYHGTHSDFTAPKVGHRGGGVSGSREGPLGLWTTDSPHTGSHFADWSSRGLEGAKVMPLVHRMKNPWVVHNYNDIRDLVDRHTKFSRPNMVVGGRQIRMIDDKVDYDAARKELMDKGHDGIHLKDTLTDSPDGKTKINQFVHFHGNQLRSKYARFDKHRAHENDLMA
jgi:hypothetical protein